MIHATTAQVERKLGETVRFDAWRAVFEKTNRIISGKPIKVEIQAANPTLPPSWTDGETVTFNGHHVAEMLRTTRPLDAVLRLKGLNYHELSHVLYSPRASDELARLVQRRMKDHGDPLIWKAFNALEDQRIETWFTASYGTSRRYFEAIILQWLVNEGNTEAAILLYGRKYLPSKLRVDAGAIFIAKHGNALYEEFQGVIDKYLSVVLPADTQRAFQLVMTFRELLARLNGRLPEPPVPDNGCSGNAGADGHGVVKKGRASAKDAREAKEAAEEAVNDAKADDDAYRQQAEADAQAKAQEPGDESGEGDAGDDGEGDAEGGAGESGHQGQGDLSGEGTGGSSGEDPGDGSTDVTDNVSESDDAGRGGQGAGGGSADHTATEADLASAVAELIEAAREGLDEIAADEAVVEDAEKVLDAVKAVEANGKIDANGDRVTRAMTVAPGEDEMQVLRRVVQTLRKIQQEAEPQTLRRQPNGRVDARRMLTRRPNEIDVFTQYDEGDEEATGVEAVILLDISGSMVRQMRVASGAMWVLKRAFDKVGIRCTVLAYDTEAFVIWQGREKAESQIPVLRDGGGTDPTDALRQAALILGKSHAANKVLVTITDGSWSANPETVKSLMRAMHKGRVTSLILGIGTAWSWKGADQVMGGPVLVYGKHEHQEGHDLSSIRALPTAVLKLVAGVMRGSLGQAV